MSPASIPGRCVESLTILGERPAVLAGVAVLMSQVLCPYDGFIHDAALYGGQVLNRVEGGSLRTDLFFKYGSQDDYSAFSVLVTPVAKAVGVPATFAVGYFASVWLYLYGAARLTGVLFSSPAVAAAGTCAMAVVPQHYGGGGVFVVPEPFLTPRLTACGFALLGLALTLRNRWLGAGGCFLAGLALHPLMAFGPAVMAVGTVLVRTLGWVPAFLLAAAGVFALTLVVAYEPWGAKVFGLMDPVWKGHVFRLTSYNFPREWRTLDWVRMAGAGATLLLAAAAFRTRPEPAAFFASALVVGGVGLAATVAAAELPYALLLQGQGYRAVWVWQVLWLPTAFAVAAAVWARGPAARLAVVLLLWASTETLLVDPPRPTITLLAAPLFAGLFRGLGRRPDDPDWAWKGFGLAWVVIFVLWNVTQYAGLRERFDAVSRDLDETKIVSTAARLTGFAVRAGAVGLFLAAVAGVLARRPRAVAAACLLAAAGIEATFVLLTELPAARAALHPHEAASRFIRGGVHAGRAEGDRRPVVFWMFPLTLWDMWYEVGAESYFQEAQVCGVVFHPGTARECVDRADRTRRLTVDELRRNPVSDDPAMLQLIGGRLTDPEPTVADLLRVAEDPSLDFIVLRREFPGVPAVTNGTWFVYDARDLRTRFPRGFPTPPGPR